MMQPGVGYKVKLNQPDQLVYPEVIARSQYSTPNPESKIQNPAAMRWEVMPGTENNMVVMAKLFTESGNILPLNDISCGVFDVNGNCRSIGYWQFVSQVNEGIWYFTVVGNLENEPLHFVYYDGEGNEYISDYGFEFVSDSKLGSPYELVNIEFQITDGDEELDIPSSYLLSQNYPNPFNLSSGGRDFYTSISYQLPESGKTILSIYNIKGQKVCDLVDEVQEAGYYSVIWAGNDDRNMPVPAGIYLYHLRTHETSLHRKMIIIK